MSFLADLTLGRYYESASTLHSLDPRVKMVGGLAILVAVLLTESAGAYLFLTVAVLAMVAAAGLSLGFVWRNVWSLKWLLAIIFVMHALLAEGTPIVSWFPRFTVEGILMGAMFAWRIGLMVSVASIVTATTSPVDLGDGVEKLLGPLNRVGVPVHELAMISVIALRFVPTLLDEAVRIMKAQMGRGASFEGGPIARAKSAVPILIPLFTSAFRRADDLALAMDARCYRGAVGRTKYAELKLGANDTTGFIVAGLIVACTIAISRLS